MVLMGIFVRVYVPHSGKKSFMEYPLDFMQGMNTRQFLLKTLQGLLPSLLINIVCTLIIYNLLSPRFPSASIIPLLVASLFPVLGNIISVLRRHRLDVIGVMILIGLAVSIVAVLLGGSPRLLLIRESFTTGAIGLVLLLSLVLPKSLGYTFARQFLTANDPTRVVGFELLWQIPFFQASLKGGTIFWGVLLLGEFLLRIVMVFTLPVMFVLVLSPIVSNGLLVGGIVVSAIWARSIALHIQKTRNVQAMKEDRGSNEQAQMGNVP